MWRTESAVTGVLGGVIAGSLVRALYRVIRRQEPRSVFDLDSGEFSWSAFVVWAVAGGLGLGIAKVLSHRLARVGWTLATGSAPPASDAPAAT